jgi:predicted RNA methylase
MDEYNKKSRKELIQICKDKKLKGYSSKTKEELVKILKPEQPMNNSQLDKFYTIPIISEKCLHTIESFYSWSNWDLVIEPSAGNGSFLTRIPTEKRIGIDISPEHEEIIKQDFLTYTPSISSGKILVVGNPPFGRVSSLAIKFFNHASKWADVIAFIVPRTFRRVSVHNKLNPNFHLIFDEEIPMEPCSFTPPMIWLNVVFRYGRRKTQREL